MDPVRAMPPGLGNPEMLRRVGFTSEFSSLGKQVSVESLWVLAEDAVAEMAPLLALNLVPE
eukprot:4204948-Lingulodinium_polyedra.AAC.1